MPHSTDPESFVPKPVEDPGGGRIKEEGEPPPSDLVRWQGCGDNHKLHRLAAKALESMIAAARTDGIEEPKLCLKSGFRSIEDQRNLWKQKKKEVKKNNPNASEEEIEEIADDLVAPPGGSAHHSGRAVDLELGYGIDSDYDEEMRETDAYKWLVQNAKRFGFYPYSGEAWHWEYNPPASLGSVAESQAKSPFSLPFTPPDENPFTPRTIESYYTESEEGAGGWYPIGANQTWHNGIHLTRPRHSDVRAVASGKVVAARYALNDELDDYACGSPGFVLVEHDLEIPDVPKGERTIGVYETPVRLPGDSSSPMKNAGEIRRILSPSESERPFRTLSWTGSQYAEIVTTEDEGRGLYCRAWPDYTTDKNRLGLLPKGTRVRLLNETHDDWQVFYTADSPSEFGWIYVTGNVINVAGPEQSPRGIGKLAVLSRSCWGKPENASPRRMHANTVVDVAGETEMSSYPESELPTDLVESAVAAGGGAPKTEHTLFSLYMNVAWERQTLAENKADRFWIERRCPSLFRGEEEPPQFAVLKKDSTYKRAGVEEDAAGSADDVSSTAESITKGSSESNSAKGGKQSEAISAAKQNVSTGVETASEETGNSEGTAVDKATSTTSTAVEAADRSFGSLKEETVVELTGATNTEDGKTWVMAKTGASGDSIGRYYREIPPVVWVPEGDVEEIATDRELKIMVSDEDDDRGINCRAWPDYDPDENIKAILPKGEPIWLYPGTEREDLDWVIVQPLGTSIPFGWIATSDRSNGDPRIEELDESKANALEKGECVVFDEPVSVEAGDPLANVGLIHPADLLQEASRGDVAPTEQDDEYGVHLETFSAENILTEDHMEAGNWVLAEDDTDKDMFCDSDQVLKAAKRAKNASEAEESGKEVATLVEKTAWDQAEAKNAQDVEEVRTSALEAVRALRKLITRNTSFWAVDWENLGEEVKATFAFKEEWEQYQEYMWWQECEENGLEIGKQDNVCSPADGGMLYHYHPVAILNYLHKQLSQKGYGQLVTLDQLVQAVPNAEKSDLKKYVGPVNDAMHKYEINTPLRVAHFIAQVGHESANFEHPAVENGSTEYFKNSYGPDTDVGEILGNTQEGDGPRFKGRGLIQLTGRSNYERYGSYAGLDLSSKTVTGRANREKLGDDPHMAADVAGWYWKTRNLNESADADNVREVTYRINGGYNGLEDRKRRLKNAKDELLRPE